MGTVYFEVTCPWGTVYFVTDRNLKWSWNESTTPRVKNVVNWQWTNAIPLLHTKTADTAHTGMSDPEEVGHK